MLVTQFPGVNSLNLKTVDLDHILLDGLPFKLHSYFLQIMKKRINSDKVDIIYMFFGGGYGVNCAQYNIPVILVTVILALTRQVPGYRLESTAFLGALWVQYAQSMLRKLLI